MTTEPSSLFFDLPLPLALALPPLRGFPNWAGFILRRSHNREEKMRHLASPRCILRNAMTWGSTCAGGTGSDDDWWWWSDKDEDKDEDEDEEEVRFSGRQVLGA